MAPGTRASLGRSRAMTRSALIFRSAGGLSEMNMLCGVHGGAVPATATGKAVDGIHRRVGLYNIDHLPQNPVHGLERGILVGLNRTYDASVILLRKETLGYMDVKVNVQRDGRQQYRQSNRRKAQHGGQASCHRSSPPR